MSFYKALLASFVALYATSSSAAAIDNVEARQATTSFESSTSTRVPDTPITTPVSVKLCIPDLCGNELVVLPSGCCTASTSAAIPTTTTRKRKTKTKKTKARTRPGSKPSNGLTATPATLNLATPTTLVTKTKSKPSANTDINTSTLNVSEVLAEWTSAWREALSTSSTKATTTKHCTKTTTQESVRTPFHPISTWIDPVSTAGYDLGPVISGVPSTSSLPGLTRTSTSTSKKYHRKTKTRTRTSAQATTVTQTV